MFVIIVYYFRQEFSILIGVSPLSFIFFYVYDPIKFIAACWNKHACLCYDSYSDVLSNIPYRNNAVLVELWEIPNNSGERYIIDMYNVLMWLLTYFIQLPLK